MPAAPRIARALLVVSALASVSAVVVTSTGGFRAELGALRVSMRSPWPSVWVCLGAAVMSLLLAPGTFGGRVTSLVQWVRHRAAGFALAAAVATLLTGLVHGSAVPSGADASGYLGQAQLWRRGELRVLVPAIADAPWPDAASTSSPLGYRPGPQPNAIVPTYPPGLPLHFALAGALAGEWGERTVVPLLGALGIWCTFLLGRRLAGALAGLAAAVLLATSPVWLNQLVQPMSDVPVTAWWLASLALASATRGRIWTRVAAAGAAAGLAWLVRPNLVLLLPVPLLLSLSQGHSTSSAKWRALAGYTAGALPALVLLAAFNTALYGAPWTSGYGSANELFAVSFVATNVGLYSGWLADVHAPLLLAAALGAGVLVAWRRRPGVRALSPALAVLALAVVASYLAYAPFETWTYLRFLLPAIAVLALAAGALVEAAVGPGSRFVAPVALLALVALAGSSWDLARDRDVFSTARREQRYALAAEWVNRHAPPETAMLAAQHSGSLHAATGRAVVRWDLLDAGRAPSPSSLTARTEAGRPWLDVAWTGAFATGAGAAAPAWLVVDADEEPAFRRRFASVSELGRLDWPPSASTDPPSAVRIYRLEDRARYLAGEPVRTERIPAGATR
jgi:hypothetical protein